MPASMFDKPKEPEPRIASESLKKALLERAASRKGYWPAKKKRKRNGKA